MLDLNGDDEDQAKRDEKGGLRGAVMPTLLRFGTHTTLSELHALPANLDDRLARVVPPEQPNEAVDALIEPDEPRLAHLEAPVRDPLRKIGVRDVVLRRVVEHDEPGGGRVGVSRRRGTEGERRETVPLDLGSLGDEVEVHLEALRVRVVVRAASIVSSAPTRRASRKRKSETHEIAPQTGSCRDESDQAIRFERMRLTSDAGALFQAREAEVEDLATDVVKVNL